MSSKSTQTTDAENGIESDYEQRVAKRAEWESFETELGAPGHLKVRNLSHGRENASEHTYIVAIEGGEAVRCTCKADEYRSGPCKHRVFCEGHDALMRAASASESDVRRARGLAVADGGTAVTEHSERTEDSLASEGSEGDRLTHDLETRVLPESSRWPGLELETCKKCGRESQPGRMAPECSGGDR